MNFITHKTPTSYEYQANCASRCSASKVCTVRAESARSLPLTVLSSLAEAILNRVKSSLSFDSSNGIFDLGRWLQRRSNARYNARYNARTSHPRSFSCGVPRLRCNWTPDERNPTNPTNPTNAAFCSQCGGASVTTRRTHSWTTSLDPGASGDPLRRPLSSLFWIVDFETKHSRSICLGISKHVGTIV